MSPAEPLLSVTDLQTHFPTEDGLVQAVNGLSFEVYPGETLSIVGESGSGKSVTALTIMRLLPDTARVSGSVLFEGEEILDRPEKQMRRMRGRDIAMIFQDPMTALNPVFTVGNQLIEAIRVHDRGVSKSQARDRSIELLDLVGIPMPEQRIENYPHEFSGGMRQRAMIAMAIANNPRVLIADEPTTALDVTIQAQVMQVLQTAQEATGAAIILITHDLGLVAGFADRVQVMYGGRIFESSTTNNVYYGSRNPYTRGLMKSIPRFEAREKMRLDPITGSPPSLISPPRGCVFRPRCEYAEQRCYDEEPQLRALEPGHLSRCHFAEDLPELEPLVQAEADH